MRLAYLSQYFPPESNAPAIRAHETARELVARGHVVHVVTAQPNHPRGVVFPGYRAAAYLRERLDGVEVHRVPTLPVANRGTVLRSLQFLEVAAMQALVAGLRLPAIDLVLASSPQLLVGAAGLALARSRGVPLAFEVRDLWPDSLGAVGVDLGGPLMRGLRRLEDTLYRLAAGVVVVSDGFVDHVRAHGVTDDRIAVIENGIDFEEFRLDETRDVRRELAIPDDALLIGFVGTLGLAQDAGILVRAAVDPRLTDVHFVLVGDGADRDAVAAEIERLGARARVHLLPPVVRERVPALLHAFDACAVVLREHPVLDTVLPSKLFEAMAVGRPILLGARGRAEQLVRTAGAGIVHAPGDVEATVSAVERLRALGPQGRARMGAAGHAYVHAHHDRRALVARLEAFLEKLRARASS